MLNHMLIAAGGIVGLMLAWVAVQNLKRRSDPNIRDGEDVLLCGTCGARSCAGCAGHHPTTAVHK